MGDSSDDSDDDIPLSARPALVAAAPPPAAAPAKEEAKPEAPAAAAKRPVEAPPAPEAKKAKPSDAERAGASAKRKEAPSTASTNGNGSAAPAAKAPKPAASAPPAKRPADDDSSDDDVDDMPLSQRQAAAKPKVEAKPAPKPAAPTPVKAEKKPKPAPKAAAAASSSADGPSTVDAGDKWYEQEGIEKQWKRGGIKWQTLEHGGVCFPPPYAPHGKPLIYDGAQVPLQPDQEELASMFAAMKDTEYGKNEVFQKNFWSFFRPLLKIEGAATYKVKRFEKCDWSVIADHLAVLAAAKKVRTKDEKAAEKVAKDALEDQFAYATVDGRKEKVGNFRVEPPGLFRGRGQHPKMGVLKTRVLPEDVTLNLSKGAKVPPVPDMGDGKTHKWGAIVHVNTVTWLAKWKDSVNGEDKQVFLAANSSFKGVSDMAKYEKARQLKLHIEKVRRDYTRGMEEGKSDEQQQHSVAVYLIDKLALRVGNEKNTDEEADTVGCCSLRVEHVIDDAGDNMLHLNFLGKDSIEYNNTTPILPRVYQLIKRFCRSKKPEDQVFHHVDPSNLNEYFKTVMEGLSAKVFRTYNASVTLDAELRKTDQEVTEQKQLKQGRVDAYYHYYNIANKNVAELCNHQRATPASHNAALEKMDEKINKVKQELADAKKAKNASKVTSLTARVDKMLSDREVKDETKNVSLGTSKINYNDPRITVAWCKRHEVPIQKPFPKTLLSKFTWAMSADPDYVF